jgi:hypothetical protein
MATNQELNLTDESPDLPTPSRGGGPGGNPLITLSKPFNPDEVREAARGDLARGLLWLLALAIGGVLLFVGIGRVDGTVITQSIFPSLVALAGTALGFYFGSSTKSTDTGGPPSRVVPGSGTPPISDAGADQAAVIGATVTLKGRGSAASGAPVTYAWTLTTPGGSKTKLSQSDIASPTFAPDVAGKYVAQLTVSDGSSSSSASQTITVAPA